MSYLTALLALWLQATTPDSNLNSLAEQIEEVTVRGDVADLDRHAETLESWLQHEELSNRELCLYTVAYTKWRLAYLPGHEAIAERGVLLRDAESYLRVYADSCGLKTAFLGNGGRNAATIFSLRYSSSR